MCDGRLIDLIATFGIASADNADGRDVFQRPIMAAGSSRLLIAPDISFRTASCVQVVTHCFEIVRMHATQANELNAL